MLLALREGCPGAFPGPSHRHLSRRMGKRHRAQRQRRGRPANQDGGRANVAAGRATPPRSGRTMCRRTELESARSCGRFA